MGQLAIDMVHTSGTVTVLYWHRLDQGGKFYTSAMTHKVQRHVGRQPPPHATIIAYLFDQ